MKMIITTGNSIITQQAPNRSKQPLVKQQTNSISGSMICRIHLIKPGCGGCGR